MPNLRASENKVIITAGLLFIAAGFLLNQWLLATLFSRDGVIAGPHKIIIWIVDIFSVSTGTLLILYRHALTKEKMLGISGMAFIVAGILFDEKNLSVLLTLEMSNAGKTLVQLFDLSLMSAGALFIIYSFRKSVRHKGNIVLCVMTSLICLIFFLAYDFYQSYLFIENLQYATRQVSDIEDVHRMDNRLGWTLIPGSIGKHKLKGEGNFNVTYEIDQNGFKKTNNNTDDPDFNIYFFGDSFTFGVGVDNKDTFPNIIKQKYLRKEIHVYNAGVMGYGIVQMCQRFMDLESRIEEGDLIIFTPIAHDIKRNIKDFYFPYFLMLTNQVPMGYFPYYDQGIIRYHRVENSFYNRLKLIVLGAPHTGKYWLSFRSEFIPDTTKEARNMIEIIRQRTEMKGGKFILFFLPYPNDCLKGRYDVDISGFDYYDILDYFPSDKQALQKIIFKNDSHWNVNGHEIAARAVVETLVREQIIDEKYLKVRLIKELDQSTIAVLP
jgi:hypothetical protein